MAWGLQNLLDQIALICGGAAVAGRPGVYSGAGRIDGVEFAYSRGSAVIDKLPAAVALLGRGDQVPPDGDVEEWRHTVRVWLLIGQSQESNEVASALAAAFVDRLRERFDAKVTLNGAADGGAWLASYEPKTLNYQGKQYFGVEFLLRATEEESVDRAA